LFLGAGANIEYFSLHAAHLHAEVIAVEPNPLCIENIRSNIAGNEPTVELHPLARGKSPGETMLHIDRADNLGGGSTNTLRSAGGVIKVAVNTLD
jgi:FkbM family methyltransferase